jgi:hypothetical protein
MIPSKQLGPALNKQGPQATICTEGDYLQAHLTVLSGRAVNPLRRVHAFITHLLDKFVRGLASGVC